MKLTINEVARSLDLPLSTVERWIRQGRIPIQRSGPTYSFNRQALEKWAKSHNLIFSVQDVAQASDTDGPAGVAVSADRAPEGRTLLQAMQQGGVHYGIPGRTVDEVLTAAVEVVTDFPASLKAELLERLLARERLTSTGIGKGIAIPHPRTPFSDEIDGPVIVTCFLETPIDYMAVDNQPVFILFILLSPSPRQHLQILSRLSFCLRDDGFVAFLKEIPDRDAFFDRVGAFEQKLDQKGLV